MGNLDSEFFWESGHPEAQVLKHSEQKSYVLLWD